jgi:predicted metal-dependent hydrolase
MAYQLQIKKSTRKTIAIVVRSSSLVELKLPLFINQKTGLEFLKRKENWVNNKIKLFKNRELFKVNHVAKFFDSTKDILYKFHERLNYWSNITGISYKTLKLSKAKSKWGYCKRDKTIGLNISLFNLDLKFLDYVIVHELCHIRHFNHSKSFWLEVEKYYPKYLEIRKELKKHQVI